MKKTLFLFLLVVISAFKAQLVEVDLPAPGSNMPDTNLERAIFYGKTPAHWNGKTIVFTHGFTSTASSQTGIPYKRAFDDKYRAVFISTTKGESMMDNAKLFAQGLDQISKKLGTSRFYMYGFSNGGKSIDIALTLLGKQDMAIKVAAVATPLRGTQIANLGSWPLFRWIISPLQLNDGMSTSTTYYMDAIRSAVDGSVNDRPNKYYTFVHTGFWNSDNDFWGLSWVKMLASGTLIKVVGGGSNDGVCPYYSNIKPGGHVMIPEGGKRNHSTTPVDKNTWDKVNAVFSDNSGVSKTTNTNESELTEYSEKAVANPVEYSNYQLVYNEQPQVIVKRDSEKYTVTRITKGQERSFAESSKSVEVKDYIKGIYQGRDVDPQEKYLDIYVDTDNKGFVLERNTKMNMLMIKNIDGSDIAGSTVDVSVHKFSNEESTSSRKVKDLAFSYNAKQKSYTAFLNDYEDGIYTINIHVENNNYSRDLISGFLKGTPKLITELKSIADPNAVVKTKSNTASISKNTSIYPVITIQEEITTPVVVSFYDASGKIAYNNTFKTSNNQIEVPKIFPQGLYIVKISYNSKEEVIKFLK